MNELDHDISLSEHGFDQDDFSLNKEEEVIIMKAEGPLEIPTKIKKPK